MGAIFGHASDAVYAQRIADNMHGCGKFCPLQFFKCKFEKFLIVVSTMCPHIKLQNVILFQMEKELQAYIVQFVNEMENK